MNQLGFVYIEMLLVSILLTVMVVLTPIIHQNICEARLNRFVETFSSDLSYGMEYSLTHFDLVKIKFNQTTYEVWSSTSKIKATSYDSSIDMDSYLDNNTIEITHGTVITTAYFYISCGNLKYKITLLEKSGMLDVSK